MMLQPPAATRCLSRPQSIHKTVVDGNLHKLTFFFAGFLKMLLTFVLHVDVNASNDE